jgi:signal transduction histidine kinase
LILEALGAGVVGLDANGVVVSANPHASQILQRGPRELDGKTLAEIAPAMGRKLAEAPATTRGEATITSADGTPAALGFSTSPVEDPDGRLRTVLLLQDISALQEIRRQRDRLLQIAVIGEIMPTLLHEIRNPLAAVTAMLEVMIEDATPELATDLHAILGEVGRITLGLQGIGALVRTLHSPTHCAVDLAVREACRLIEQMAAKRGVKVLATGPDLAPVPIDRSAICGLVFNLAKNAIEACTAGGHVTVDVRIDGEDLVLSVDDDGVGMTPETLTRCRELFYTTKDAGSGIGLALCAEVVAASGGTLSVDSRAGDGTRIVARVPLHPPAAAPASAS